MEENNQEKKVLDLPKIFLYVFEVIVLILLISYVYFAMSGNKEYSGVYSEHAQKQIIEALFTSLNLQTIHEIPYLYIQQGDYFVNSYYLEVVGGTVEIHDGVISDKDLIIWTTEEEVGKIIENSDYIKESLISGRTNIEKTASDFVLFSKGYPALFID